MKVTNFYSSADKKVFLVLCCPFVLCFMNWPQEDFKVPQGQDLSFTPLELCNLPLWSQEHPRIHYKQLCKTSPFFPGDHSLEARVNPHSLNFFNIKSTRSRYLTAVFFFFSVCFCLPGNLTYSENGYSKETLSFKAMKLSGTWALKSVRLKSEQSYLPHLATLARATHFIFLGFSDHKMRPAVVTSS